MTTRRDVLTAALVLAATALPAAAGAGDWVVLGRRAVAPGMDRDRVVVGGSRRFDALRLEVAENGILIDRLRVTFGNGRTVAFELRNFIERGGRTRVIDLPGAARAIRHIDLVFARRPGGGRAVVTVLGREA